MENKPFMRIAAVMCSAALAGGYIWHQSKPAKQTRTILPGSKSTAAAAACRAFAEAEEIYHRTDYDADGVLETVVERNSNDNQKTPQPDKQRVLLPGSKAGGFRDVVDVVSDGKSSRTQRDELIEASTFYDSASFERDLEKFRAEYAKPFIADEEFTEASESAASISRLFLSGAQAERTPPSILPQLQEQPQQRRVLLSGSKTGQIAMPGDWFGFPSIWEEWQTKSFSRREEAAPTADQARAAQDEQFRRRVSKLLEQVKDLFDRKNYQAAERLALNVLKIDPLNPEAEALKSKSRAALHKKDSGDEREMRREEPESKPVNPQRVLLPGSKSPVPGLIK